MKIIAALWDVLNGKKMNTGTIMVIAALIMERVLGASHDEATQIASSIMMGIGGVTALIGYIHRIIKSAKKVEKK